MILLDTHALIWLDSGSSRLGVNAHHLIDQSLKDNDLFVSAISFWEVGMLVEKGRLKLQLDLFVWRLSLLDNGLQEIPLQGDTALSSACLSDFHGDPADRIIVATAIRAGASLCTADEKILNWKEKLLRLDARV